MIRALYTASTGMKAQQLNIDSLAHNMSNVNTTGYKKERVEFQDLLYQNLKRPTVNEENNQPTNIQLGLGVKPVAITTQFSQGNLQATDNPLDVAINGNGFFKIEVPEYEEPLFTCDGSFKIDDNGDLVTSGGYRVLGVDTLDEGAYDIAIDKLGLVTYKLPDDEELIEAGQIEIAKFINPLGLKKLGENLYQSTISSGEAIDWEPDEDTTISLHANYLEASNVQVVEEMINLITAQRAYEFNSKLIQASDEMLQTAANLRR